MKWNWNWLHSSIGGIGTYCTSYEDLILSSFFNYFLYGLRGLLFFFVLFFCRILFENYNIKQNMWPYASECLLNYFMWMYSSQSRINILNISSIHFLNKDGDENRREKKERTHTNTQNWVQNCRYEMSKEWTKTRNSPPTRIITILRNVVCIHPLYLSRAQGDCSIQNYYMYDGD